MCLSWLEGAPVAGDGLEWSCVRASLLEGVAVGHWYGGTYFGDLSQNPYLILVHSRIRGDSNGMRALRIEGHFFLLTLCVGVCCPRSMQGAIDESESSSKH